MESLENQMEKTLSLKEKYAEHIKLHMAFPICRKVMAQKRE
jgi:hypothetical protein